MYVQAALSTRDLARTSQQKQEVSLLSEGKDRDKKLSEHRYIFSTILLLLNFFLSYYANVKFVATFAENQ